MSGYGAPGYTPARSVAQKRRGFGLFDSDDEDSAMESVPVKFSGDRSGFTDLGGGLSEASTIYTSTPIQRNSRDLKLTTPSRSAPSRSARSVGRHTPYSSTTARALQRVKSRTGGTENEEEEIVSQSVYTTPKTNTAGHTPRFIMRGALSNIEAEEDSAEEVASRQHNFSVTPNRNLFAKETPTKSAQRSQPTSASAEIDSPDSKFWSRWIEKIVPESVRKPVSAIFGAHEDPSSSRKKDIFHTPEQGDEFPSIPGSFEKPTSDRKKDGDYINPNFLREAERRSPSSSQGLVTRHNTPFGLSPAQTNWTREDSMSLTPSRSQSRALSSSPPTTTPPPVNAFKRQSNFIERMRSAKKQRRYDPYARPSKTPQKKEKDTSPKELTTEEELEEVMRKERALRVENEENKYMKRELYKRLGREMSDDEDEMMDDSHSSFSKGKGKEVSIEEADDVNSGAIVKSVSPIKSPQKVPESPEKPSQPTGNLFGAPLPAQPSFSVSRSFTMEDADAVGPMNEPGSFSETESESGDKENQIPSIPSSPPPPPAPTHRKLPGPAVNSFQPPPMASGSLFGTSAPQQPVGGFGLGLAPSEPAPLVRQRNQAQRHRPSVSSGLRNSETVETEKENESYADKENGGEGSSSGANDVAKQGKAIAQYTKPPSVSSASSSALMEIEGNEMAAGQKKVDVRALVAALPSSQVACVVEWPNVEVHGNKAVQEAIKGVWAPEFSKGVAEAFKTMIGGAVAV